MLFPSFVAPSFVAQASLAVVLARSSGDAAVPTPTPPSPLEVRHAIEGRLEPDASQSYSVALGTGQVLVVRTLRRDADVAIKLVGPDETTLAETSEPRLLWIAEAPGVHRVEVTGPSHRRAAIRYAIVLEELRPGTEADRARLAAQTATLAGSRLEQGEAGDRREAIARYEEAQALWHQAGDRGGESAALLHAADVHHNLGETDKALECSRRALELSEALDDQRGQAEALAYVGRTEGERGQEAEAMASVQRAAALYAAIQDQQGEHIELQNLASIHGRLGDYERAVELLERVLGFARETGNLEGQTYALQGLGMACLGQGDVARALGYEEQAVAGARRMGSAQGEAFCLMNVGGMQARLGRTAAALQTYQNSLALWQKLGNYWREATVRRHLGALYVELGDYKRGREWLESSLLGHRAAGDAAGEAEALFNLARAEQGQGELGRARENSEAALGIYEATRGRLPSEDLRASYLAAKHRTYELEVDVLMDLDRKLPGAGYDRTALEASERARARSLLDLLAEAGVDLQAGVDPALLQRERDLESALKASAERQLRLLASDHSSEETTRADAEVVGLTAELRDARTHVREASPRLASLAPALPRDATAIQRNLLDPDTLLLEYSLGEKRSFVWAVTSTVVAAHELPGRPAIERLARRLYGQFSTGDTEPDVAALRALGRLLLGPVLPNARHRLVVVPDGVLHYLPFGALTLPGGKRLVDTHTIVYLPSASTLAGIRSGHEERPRPAKAVAVLADPVYSSDDPRLPQKGAVPGGPTGTASAVERSAKESGLLRFDRLYASRGEAAMIARLAGAEGALEALDFDASYATATSPALGEYRIVHFATHSLLNSRHPELSGLVLSLLDPHGNPQNGFLQAHEIYNLKLNADLVVLSACQTALGSEIRGEGVVGLARAFLNAGARSVVASLWRVPDAATAELMKRFYTGMLVEKLAPSEAFRQAQEWVKRTPRWSAPYYWAGFTFQGEWN
jgi:CHAT domain-containing protein/tetratricopeptide (TPR) repeat protein